MGMENGSNSDSNETTDRGGNLGRAEVEDTSTATASAVSAVLGDDNLLHKILLRIGFPNCLVHASLVCKRWHALASSPAFLRHFHEFHTPRVLGFYVHLDRLGGRVRNRQRFIPVPQPAELVSITRRAQSDLDLDIFEDLLDCWEGSDCILTSLSFHSELEFDVRWPLNPARGRVRLPHVPEKRNSFWVNDIFPNGDDHVHHFFCLQVSMKGQRNIVDVYKLSLGDDAWTIHLSLSLADMEDFAPIMNAVLVGNTICLLATVHGTTKLVLLDLGSSSLSLVELPEDVEDVGESFSQLSRVDDSIHLILVKGCRINVWTWQMDDGSWSLLNSFDLFETCGGLSKSPDMELCRGGAQAELVHVRINCYVYMLDCKRKIIDKVFELPQNVHLRFLYPYLMGGMKHKCPEDFIYFCCSCICVVEHL